MSVPSVDRFLDPEALTRIKSLELRARVVVEGVWKGLHRSPLHGFSVEFSEYRPYTPGDDLRHVDWKVAARTDRYFVKRYEDETNVRCQIVLDRSPSMEFGDGGWSKADFAATLAATLAMYLGRQGDAVGLTTFAEQISEHIPPRNRPGHTRRLIQEMERPVPAGHTGVEWVLERLADLLRRRGMICLISDLLAPVERLREQLGLLGALGQDVVLFHVMDPEELELDLKEAILLEDLESGERRWLEPGPALEEYRRQLQRHREAVESACASSGVEYLWCPTNAAMDRVLFDWISARQGRKGKVRR